MDILLGDNKEPNFLYLEKEDDVQLSVSNNVLVSVLCTKTKATVLNAEGRKGFCLPDQSLDG